MKQGLVSDYGLPEEYLTEKIGKQARENKLLRQTQHTLDRLSAMSPDQLAVAYQWLQEKPDIRCEQDLIAKLPADQQAVMHQVKSDIDNLSHEAVALGLITPETYERNKMAYVHRSYKKYEAELTGSQAVARQCSQRLKGDQFKGRGMELEASLDRVRGDLPADLKGMKLEMLECRDGSGKLTRREYLVQWQARPDALRDYTSAGTWEVRDATKGGNIKVWRDFTLEERQRMPSDVCLAADGVYGDNTSLQVQHPQQLGNGGDLVALAIDVAATAGRHAPVAGHRAGETPGQRCRARRRPMARTRNGSTSPFMQRAKLSDFHPIVCACDGGAQGHRQNGLQLVTACALDPRVFDALKVLQQAHVTVIEGFKPSRFAHLGAFYLDAIALLQLPSPGAVQSCHTTAIELT